MTRYTSLPSLPDRIDRLEELAIDLWWSWHPEARIVFGTLDYGLWRATAHNPVRMLWVIPRTKLDDLISEASQLTAIVVASRRTAKSNNRQSAIVNRKSS